MSESAKVIVVCLRQPKRDNLEEARSDPFYEFGSFGCTGCHRRNVMNLRRVHELDGYRVAFAQGGSGGFRLVLLTTPVQVRAYSDRAELLWQPAEAPFRYGDAPVLARNDGYSDFPRLLQSLGNVNRSTLVAKFTSAFRSRRKPLGVSIAEEIVSQYNRLRDLAKPDAIAVNYTDALPFPPNKPDLDRAGWLSTLRARGEGRKLEIGVPRSSGECGSRVSHKKACNE